MTRLMLFFFNIWILLGVTPLKALSSFNYVKINPNISKINILEEPEHHEIIYSNSFLFKQRVFTLIFQQLPATSQPFTNKVILQYNREKERGHIIGGNGCPPLTETQEIGIVQICASLVKLEREILVTSLVEPLKKASLFTSDTSDYLLKDDESINNLSNKIRDEFINFQQNQLKLIDAPIAGIMQIKKDVLLEEINNSFFGSKTTDEVEEKFVVDSVQIQVEDGNITNLHAFGSLGNETMMFYNHSPIGISNRNNINKWYKSYLVAKRNDNKYKTMHLSDLLEYIPNLTSRSDDWSPADGVYVLKPNTSRVERTLFKAASSRILQARIYSDLIGVDNDRPNGLIQLEVEKKIIINNTTPGTSSFMRVGFLNYFKPTLSINKVEEKNKAINTRSEFLVKPKIDAIEIVSHINSSIGLEVNAVSIFIPALKSTLHVDYGVKINRVALVDSSFDSSNDTYKVLDTNLNILAHGLIFKASIRPDSRFGVDLKFSRSRLKAVSDDVEVVKIGNTTFGQLSSYELLGWAKITESSELFIRPQITHLAKKEVSNKSYFQMQVGYQFDIFSKNRDKPLIKQVF
ncbi:hypothetical protein [Adhaeribacter rhizoryzae]|uniref:Uncharacterized protein n=1 Tax=Adhaeribacter rhizoryzae TaxID=2607907 RepID=A0A5M6DT58_9BACT|nr:hypothetical protein [Adhaeribacter rhizoryzae]KAA5548595.1 hypothetical protein F0145_03500 [Adhaeribacter rhizoryzae]